MLCESAAFGAVASTAAQTGSTGGLFGNTATGKHVPLLFSMLPFIFVL